MSGSVSAALYGNGDFTGQVEASDRGIVQLVGARQLATGRPGQGPSENSVSEFGRLSAGPDDFDNQSQLFGTTNVSGFGPEGEVSISWAPSAICQRGPDHTDKSALIHLTQKA